MHDKLSKIMEIKSRFDHFNVNVTDLDRSLKFYAEALGLKEIGRKQAADGSFVLVYLGDGESPFRLSGGQKKRVAIATVLAMEPSVLVMDEPTSNLDPRARRQIIDLIRRFGHTTLIATHDMEMVLDLCDRTIVMKEGRIVADGSTRHVFGDLALLEECGLEQPCELRMKRALKKEYAP